MKSLHTIPIKLRHKRGKWERQRTKDNVIKAGHEKGKRKTRDKKKIRELHKMERNQEFTHSPIKARHERGKCAEMQRKMYKNLK